MISKKMNEAMQKQINEELFSAYLYLSMSAYFLARNLDGFAGWFKVQAQEELSHAMKFFHFLDELGQPVRLAAIQGPKIEWKSPLAAFEEALKHERHISSCIHRLYQLAGSESHYPTQVFLQWFVKEQVEEEDTADSIVEKLKLIEGHAGGLMMIDHELSHRQFKS